MKKIIIANWKMTPSTIREARELFVKISRAAGKLRNAKVVVCPPFVYLGLFSKNSKVGLGGQDVFWEEGGSYTGEISASMLKSLNAKYVIIGHSERRRLGETNEMVNQKIKQALKYGFKVIFCVGESERDESENYLQFIKEEVIKGFEQVPVRLFKDLIVVYEPIWAISSAKKFGKVFFHADTPENVFQMGTYIKRVIVSAFGKNAGSVPILYGGSVDAKNAVDFLVKGNVDGFLVGRTSWNAEEFGELLKNVNKI